MSEVVARARAGRAGLSRGHRALLEAHGYLAQVGMENETSLMGRSSTTKPRTSGRA
jgi:hypothetical protein